MAESCEHLAGLKPEDFPPRELLNACEECLVEGTFWVCASRVPIVRPRRLLRFLDGQARNQTLPRDATCGHARCPACGLDMVAHRRMRHRVFSINLRR